MKYLIHKFILITLPFIATSTVTADAATVTTPPKAAQQPATAAPPIPSTQSAPKFTSPVTQGILPCNQAVATTGTQTQTTAGGISAVGSIATATLGPNYVGPTPNITAVANAIGLRAKSLTTQITVRSGLALTKPVGLTVDYASPAAQYRAVQSYDGCNGNRFLYNDPISGPVNSPGYAIWGKPRQMTINITLSEDKPGGQPYVYTIPLKLNLDPLFDVAISPLRFTMTTDCDTIGDSEIRFSWTTPENQLQKKSFSANKNEAVTVNEFAWARQEASASASLLWPQWSFYEHDPVQLSGAYIDGFSPPTIKLLPGSSGYVGRHIKDAHGQGGCEADIAFDMTITLHTYNNL